MEDNRRKAATLVLWRMKLESQRARQKPRFTRYANALLPTCATVILFFRFAMQPPCESVSDLNRTAAPTQE
jgi:hypothetical protein